MYSALIVASLTIGYWAGTHWSHSSTIAQPHHGGEDKPQSERTAISNVADSDASGEELPDEDLNAVKPSSLEDCKLVRSS